MAAQETLLATRFLPGEIFPSSTKSADLVVYIARWRVRPRLFRPGGYRYQVRMIDLDRGRVGRAEYESEIYTHPALAIAEIGRVTGVYATASEIEEIEQERRRGWS